MKNPHLLRNILILCLQIALVAAFLVYGYMLTSRFIIGKVNSFISLPLPVEIPQINFKLKNLWNKREALIANRISFLEINLKDMVVRLYKDGIVVKEYPIKVKGRENDWGETPSGFFSIQGREISHFSSLGSVFMPYSLRFQGNYYVHGLPYYSDGSLSGADFSSGCINLSTADAKQLFQLVPLNFPVLVLENDYQDPSTEIQNINFTPPKLLAQSYLVADMDNSQIFISKDPQTISPIVGANKLLTAVVASELLRLSFDPNLIDKLYINEKMLLPPGETVGLTLGKRFPFFDLYYPLLVEHSNDASEALALRFSRNYLGILKERAISLGMNNTSLADSYGSENNNFSTSEDLFYLLRYLFNNRLWMLNISRGQIYKDFGTSAFTNLKNKNIFNNDSNFVGGFTEQSSNGLSTSLFIFKVNLKGKERNIGMVLIGSSNVTEDIQTIRAYLEKIGG
jgi:hypothetical protein